MKLKNIYHQDIKPENILINKLNLQILEQQDNQIHL